MAQSLELRRAIVTGAAGFMATHLVPALEAAGCEPVLLWSSVAAPGQPLPGGNCRRYDVDICDYDALEKVFREEQPTTVFHLAGVRGRGNLPRRFRDCTDVNIGGTVRVIEAAQRAGVERIVMMGSAEEYGDQAGPQREDFVARPRTVYGASKAAATELARRMHAELGCPVVVLRPYTVYGPGQPAEMFIAEAVDCAVRGVPFRMSAGKQRRDFVFVRDMVEALVKAATTAGIDGEVINIGSGRATPLREVAELIWRISDSKAALEIGARPASNAELVDTWADASRAASLLGWGVRVDLPHGLEETVRAARENSVGR